MPGVSLLLISYHVTFLHFSTESMLPSLGPFGPLCNPTILLSYLDVGAFQEKEPLFQSLFWLRSTDFDYPCCPLLGEYIFMES